MVVPVTHDSTRVPRHRPSGLLLGVRLRTLGLLTTITLAGCVVVPRQTTSYNEDCQIVQKHLKLGVALLTDKPPLDCSNEKECAMLLAVYAGVAAGTAVVSGSIVLVGNTVYWLEEQGRCDWPVAEKLKQFPQALGVPLPWTQPGTQPVIPVSAESKD